MAAVTNAQIRTIDGWLSEFDMELLRWALRATREVAGGGDLAELGTYMGKSAVLIGTDLAQGEAFTVIDLFESDAPDIDNQSESDTSYSSLTRDSFEKTYARLHGDLPVVLTGPSNEIVQSARHGTHRLVHVDASHLYQHVVEDIRAARTLLATYGVIVLDDYRSRHTPGVAAAIWEARATGLKPFALSEAKLYATWGDPQPYLRSISEWASANGHSYQEQPIGNDLVCLVGPASRLAAGVKSFIPPIVVPVAKSIQRRAVRATLVGGRRSRKAGHKDDRS